MKPVRRHAAKTLAFRVLLPLLLVHVLGLESIASTDVTRVACVGDSITEGTANADHATNSWPRILGRLLDDAFPGQYEVGNFGRSGATLLRAGRKPYRDQDVFARGCDFAPQVVIINLGTNDAVNANWLEHGAGFEDDARDLIEVYRGLDTSPRIWLSTLTPMYEPHPRVAECAPHRVVIESIIARLADEYGLEVIDFTAPLADRSRLFPDGLHPNTAGNELMARASFEAITGQPAPDDASLRPRPVAVTSHELVANGQAVDVRLGAWTQSASWVEGTGAGKRLHAKVVLDDGDFHVRARLRMLGQKNSAAGFFLGADFFGFEGARGTVFRNGPHMGGLRLLHQSATLWERDAWIDFEVIRNGETVWFIVDDFIVDMATIPGPIERIGFDPTRSTMQVASWSVTGPVRRIQPPHLAARTVQTPWIDVAARDDLRTGGPVVTAKRSGLIHARTGDDRLRLATTTAQRSDDRGRTWSAPFPLAASLHGTGHTSAHLPDGRLLVVFHDGHPGSPTRGDVVAWVGTYDDIVEQREGHFTARLIDHLDDPAAPTVAEPIRMDVRDDGLIVLVARARLVPGEPPAEVRMRFRFEELVDLVPAPGYDIPLVDLDGDAGRHVLVDREPGQYLGHVTTVLLEDGRTILAVYPKGHGKGPIVSKRSTDGGRTWSDRLPTPESWATSREVPTIHRVIDPKTGKKRLIVWSGLSPARLAVSEDNGASWSELAPAGDWGGIVVMGFVEQLRDGSYLAMFHDDGRFFTGRNQRTDPPAFTLYQTFSHDGGLTWTHPETVWSGTDVHLCEPGCIRSPDGETLAVLLRENSRTRNSYVIFSSDEGATWSAPRELPASLTGDRHTGKYAPDGRLFISFRDTTRRSPTQGDWVGWVGTWEDIRDGRPGQYRVRLKDNKHRWDTTYPGVEVLPDGTFVVTTYGHWDEGEQPYILSARFTLDELDERAAGLPRPAPLFTRGLRKVHTYRIPALVTTTAGTLIAACDARHPSSRDLPNEIDTVIRRSTDGGRTWKRVQTIARWPRAEGAADPCLLVDRITGRTWCAVTWADGVGWRSSKPGYGDDSFHTLLVHSDDDGVTWSEPVDITRDLKYETWRSAWFSPGAGLQTRSGRLILPYSVADGDGRMFSYAAVSDDHGETWRRVGPIGERTNEHMIVQRSDGALVCTLRSTHGLNRRGVSLSHDDGETWSPLAHDDALVEPVCQASLLAVPASRTPDGREWLVFCNPASTKRENLTMRVSFDGGATWPVARLLQHGPSSYSCMTLLPGGGIGVLYEHGQHGSAERISFARVSWDWLVPASD